jgi:hypothetical protein
MGRSSSLAFVRDKAARQLEAAQELRTAFIGSTGAQPACSGQAEMAVPLLGILFHFADASFECLQGEVGLLFVDY